MIEGMGNRTLPLILAVIILALVAVAGWYVLGRDTGSTPPLAGEEQGAKARETLTDAGQYYEITGAYPGKIDELGFKASGALALMKGFVEQEAARFKENNVAEITDNDIQIMQLGGDRKFTLAVDYKEYESPDTVSFVFSMFADTLGAHPNGYYRTFTFSKKDGSTLILNDLFTGNYLDTLSKLSREKVAANLEEVTGGSYDQDYLEAGTTPDADNFQNFYLDGSDFVILFPPYQVGPWVIGTQEARIPRSELSDVLQSTYQ